MRVTRLHPTPMLTVSVKSGIKRAMRATRRAFPIVLALAFFVIYTFASRSAVDERSNASPKVHAGPEGMLLTVHHGGPSCPKCVLRLQPLGRFGQLEDRLLLRNVPTVEHDSRGRFYATVREARDHELIVYDKNGVIVREIGRYGSGPGEFNSIEDVIVGAGDSLWILHDRNMLSVFDSAGVVARTNPLELPDGARVPRFVGLGMRWFVLTHQFALVDSLARPLHLYAPTGQYLGSFGPKPLNANLIEARLASLGAVLSGVANVAWHQAGVAWTTVPGGGYRLEEVDLSSIATTGESRDGRGRTRVIGVQLPDSLGGTPLYMTREEFERAHGPGYVEPARSASGGRSREFTPPEERPAETRLSSPSGTGVKAAMVLEDGLLVVLLRTAPLDWQDVVLRYRPDGTSEPGSLQRRYDTILDVIDIASGSVLLRERFPGDVNVTSDGTLYRPLVSVEGVISFEAFRVEFLDRRTR